MPLIHAMFSPFCPLTSLHLLISFKNIQSYQIQIFECLARVCRKLIGWDNSSLYLLMSIIQIYFSALKTNHADSSIPEPCNKTREEYFNKHIK